MNRKIAVITGGSSGLGLASAQCLAPETSLLLCARNPAGLEKAKAELETFGAEVFTCPLDASDPAAVRACAQYAQDLGEIVHVVHTAGVSPANTPAQDSLRINTLGPVNVVEAFHPLLADGGVMILFGSTAGYSFETNPQMAPLIPAAKECFGHWNEADFDKQLMGFLTGVMGVSEPYLSGSAYCLSKFFVKYFVYANVWRFAERNCRILSVSPGSYLTRMHQALIDNQPETAAGVMKGIPLQRWGHAYEMGKLVAFLCSKGAGYINGVDILADGGCTFPSTVPQIS